MSTLLSKIQSRKFLFALAGVLGIDLVGAGMSEEAVYVLVAYIIGESLVDFARALSRRE